MDVYDQGMSKTELCNKWQETGACPYGDNCQFAHGIKELRPVMRHPRYKTEVCRMMLAGDGCPYGHRCHFRHTLTDQERLMMAVSWSPPLPWDMHIVVPFKSNRYRTSVFFLYSWCIKVVDPVAALYFCIVWEKFHRLVKKSEMSTCCYSIRLRNCILNKIKYKCWCMPQCTNVVTRGCIPLFSCDFTLIFFNSFIKINNICLLYTWSISIWLRFLGI